MYFLIHSYRSLPYPEGNTFQDTYKIAEIADNLKPSIY